MNKMIKHPIVIALIAVGLAGAPALVSAQTANTNPATTTTSTTPNSATTTAQPSQATEQVSEEKVDQFVTAYVEVQKINQDYSAQLQAAAEPERATELQQEAQRKMQQAVTESGLTVPEYQQIASIAGQDAELRERIQNELEN